MADVRQCLCTWFMNNKSKKSCPDCRSRVRQQPAPAYLIKEITLVFINRTELLPPGETLEQHAKWQKEEADIVLLDKTNKDSRTGGLFKGCFRPPSLPDARLRAIRDIEDGVDRCPLCSWEIEDAMCARCGLHFDEDGTGTVSGSFGGFSDMDETSERELSVEDLDADLEMDDQDLGFEYDDEFDNDDMGDLGFQEQYYGDDQPFALQRYLSASGNPLQHALNMSPRRRAAHSAAGSRRRSYSASLATDLPESEMGTVEEEDEEDDDEDSSMNDFVVEDDDNEESSGASTSTESTPQPVSGTSSQRARNRRVIASESPSLSDSVADDEAEEDDAPVTNGRRRFWQRQTRSATSSAASSASTGSAAVAREGWTPLSQGSVGSQDEEMDEDEDDSESDGGRTTVGWEPNTISNERTRNAGSLTPIADNLHAPFRPPSRSTHARILDGSRGLRRRSSVLSVSTVHYEDGEANDDDDSDIDRDGDSRMNGAALRSRGSRVRLRTAPAIPQSSNTNRGSTLGDAIDIDTDEGSDTSPRLTRNGQPSRPRQQEYDPRISWMFAQHQSEMREINFQRSDPLYNYLEQLRATTPVARPRTANRTRTPAQATNASASPPATSSLEASQASGSGYQRVRAATGNVTTGRAAGMSSMRSEASGPSNVREASISSEASVGIVRPMLGPAHTFQPAAATLDDILDRPASRISSRPPSAAGRRGLTALPPAFSPMSPGFNAARNFQPQNRNPFMQMYVRPRQSQRALREQPSTATLRPRESRRVLRVQPSQTNVREDILQSPNIRPQSSRINLRSQPSQHCLQPQSSARALRANAAALPTQSYGLLPNGATPAGLQSLSSNSSTLTDDERRRRATELVRRRAAELSRNPYVAGIQRHGQIDSATLLNRTNQSNAIDGASSAATSQAPINASTAPTASPNLGRRRSNRNIAGATVPAPVQASAIAPARSAQPQQVSFSALWGNNSRVQGGQDPGRPPYEASLTRNANAVAVSGAR
ncbi:hypothetical protein LTS18_013596 [Coniosporium uncinatum]|uniref:Uncharacterized protein n=1 Tax=Coniosporium uncinatum TaxID=93489 RepID=A0ACC3DW15_9PEZI|nr:hypothetical protein LTS18_013596 [Coniosporium uncinatum]